MLPYRYFLVLLLWTDAIVSAFRPSAASRPSDVAFQVPWRTAAPGQKLPRWATLHTCPLRRTAVGPIGPVELHLRTRGSAYPHFAVVDGWDAEKQAEASGLGKRGGDGQAKKAKLPGRLASFSDADALLDALEKCAAQGELSGGNAATAMNHLKRLQPPAQNPLNARFDSLMATFASQVALPITALVVRCPCSRCGPQTASTVLTREGRQVQHATIPPSGEKLALAANALAARPDAPDRRHALKAIGAIARKRLAAAPADFSPQALGMLANVYSRSSRGPAQGGSTGGAAEVLRGVVAAVTAVQGEGLGAPEWSLVLDGAARAGAADAGFVALASARLAALPPAAFKPRDVAMAVNALARASTDVPGTLAWVPTVVAEMAPADFKVRPAPVPPGAHPAPRAPRGRARAHAGAPGQPEEIASVWDAFSRVLQEISPPPPRTNRTRRVPHPVLIGHAAYLTPY